MFHIFAQNKSFTTEHSVSDFVIYYRHSVFEIKNQELPATLKIEEALSSGTLVCSTYKCELRHFRPD